MLNCLVEAEEETKVNQKQRWQVVMGFLLQQAICMTNSGKTNAGRKTWWGNM